MSSRRGRQTTEGLRRCYWGDRGFDEDHGGKSGGCDHNGLGGWDVESRCIASIVLSIRMIPWCLISSFSIMQRPRHRSNKCKI